MIHIQRARVECMHVLHVLHLHVDHSLISQFVCIMHMMHAGMVAAERAISVYTSTHTHTRMSYIYIYIYIYIHIHTYIYIYIYITGMDEALAAARFSMHVGSEV